MYVCFFTKSIALHCCEHLYYFSSLFFLSPSLLCLQNFFFPLVAPLVHGYVFVSLFINFYSLMEVKDTNLEIIDYSNKTNLFHLSVTVHSKEYMNRCHKTRISKFSCFSGQHHTFLLGPACFIAKPLPALVFLLISSFRTFTF